jgi:hypothetical protein
MRPPPPTIASTNPASIEASVTSSISILRLSQVALAALSHAFGQRKSAAVRRL